MWDIVGHERAVALLDRLVASDAVSQALLFTGPVGVGKTRLAIELAKALNCIGQDPPCGVCIHCRQISAATHPDVSVVERPAGKESIAIQQVREMREAMSLRPFQGRRKVTIVSGAEALTPQASDALLKTLEEPQPQVVIMLTAQDADVLPATVVSRCRIVPLHAVPTSCLLRALQAKGLTQEEAGRLARLAGGNVGWALRAAAQPKLADQQEELVSRISGVLDMNLDARLQLAESLSSDRKDRTAVRRHLELLALLARDVLLLSQGRPALLVAGAERDTLARQAERIDVTHIHRYLRSVRVAMERVDGNVDPRLALEALLVHAP